MPMPELFDEELTVADATIPFVHSLLITLGVLVCVLMATWLGMWAHARLPQHHLDADSKDAIKVGMGLIATMSALVLGLLVASAKGSYDTQRAEIRQVAANIGLLDQLLADYGSETQEMRRLMKQAIERIVARIWQHGETRAEALENRANDVVAMAMFRAVQSLAPQDEVHRALKQEMVEITRAIAKTRWQLITEEGSVIPTPFLVILVFWLMILFASFGLFAPENTTVGMALIVCALSVSGAIFLILELDRPFEGVMQISSEPLLKALAD
jgi:hypothetical protein